LADTSILDRRPFHANLCRPSPGAARRTDETIEVSGQGEKVAHRVPWVLQFTDSAKYGLYSPFLKGMAPHALVWRDPGTWPEALDTPGFAEVLVAGRLPLRRARFWRDSSSDAPAWRPIREALPR
jgi:hypothetical protein